MIILTAPHPTLRTKAKPVIEADKKVHKFIQNLGKTLIDSSRKGVGLAAPQVDKTWRVFATYIGPKESGDRDSADADRRLEFYFNPRITNHNQQLALGPSKDDIPLEGCLSIPGIYGPVPRYQWVELEYQTLDKNGMLVGAKKKFEDFPARLIQHELDHLDGILFTDYILEYDLPLYRESERDGKLDKLEDRSIIEVF